MPNIIVPEGCKLIVLAGDVHFNEVQMKKFAPKTTELYFVRVYAPGREGDPKRKRWICDNIPKDYHPEGSLDVTNNNMILQDCLFLPPHRYFVQAYEVNVNAAGKITGCNLQVLFVDINSIPTQEVSTVEESKPSRQVLPVTSYQQSPLEILQNRLEGSPAQRIGYYNISNNTMRFDAKGLFHKALSATGPRRALTATVIAPAKPHAGAGDDPKATSSWCCC